MSLATQCQIDEQEGTSVKTTGPLDVRVIENIGELSSLRDQWNAVVESSSATIYQTFEWIASWWKHLGARPNRTLHVLVFLDGDSLVGFAPVYISQVTLMGKTLHQTLNILGSGPESNQTAGVLESYGPSDYQDFVALPQHEARVSQAFMTYLKDHSSLFDEIHLSNVPQDSLLFREILPRLDACGFRHTISRSAVCPRVIIPNSFNTYLEQLKPDVRRRLRQTQAAMTEGGMFTVESVVSREVAHKAFQDLIRLHQRRWNTLGFPGLFRDQRFEDFQKEVVDQFLNHGWLWFKTARFNGDCVAVRLGFRFKDRLYDYLSGFDGESSIVKRRPSLALLLTMITDAIESKVRIVDLLRGSEQYKLELATDRSYNWNISIFNPAVQRSFRVLIYRFLQVWTALSGRFLHEWELLCVHYCQHSPVSFFFRYLSFRWKRLLTRTQDGMPRRTLDQSDRSNYEGTGVARTRLSASISKHFSPLEMLLLPKRLHRVAMRVRSKLFGRLYSRMALKIRDAGNPIVRKASRSLERDANLPIRRKVYKAIVFGRSLLLAKAYLQKCDKIGSRGRTRGQPYIDNLGRIEIGNDLYLNSKIVRIELATGPQGFLEIGNEVSINFGVSICSEKHIKICDRVRIGPYVTIMDSDYHSIDDRDTIPSGKPTIVEDDVWLARRVTVLKGSRIGRGSVITAGSVVSGVIPPFVIAGGVPARVIRYLKPREQVVFPEEEGVGQRRATDPLTRRINQVLRNVFGVNDSVDPFRGPGDIPQWDSLGHLNLILQIEKDFGISLTEDDVAEMTTVGSIRRIIESHINNSLKHGDPTWENSQELKNYGRW